MDHGQQDIGFEGNGDLYGLGIRIGYYTAAVSIWIANLWAPTEIYFLRHVTVVFLVSMLIGVSVLSMYPHSVHAVEPFMVMHVSYCTYYMGMLMPPGQDYLRWEKEYFTFYTNAVVGIALHSYDTWYWWVGQAMMIRTPGPKTWGLFIYFGQEDLYGWITYAARAYLAFFIYLMTRKAAQNLYYHHLEKKVDHEVPPARLKTMSENWQRELEIINERDAALDGKMPATQLLSLPAHSRQPSSSSVPINSNSPRLSYSSYNGDNIRSRQASPNPDKWKDDYGEKPSQDRDEYASTPEPGIKRTMSEKLRYRLLGWRPDGEGDLGSTPVYTYHPSLESICVASDFLKSINDWTPKRWRTLLYCYIGMYTYLFILPFAALTNPFRPRVLLAISSHFDALHFGLIVPRPLAYARALKHPAYRTLRPEDIALASRIQLTNKPPGPPTRSQLFSWAWGLFGTCSLLIIGTELTINWNNIQGVNTLQTVGQLIPAAIGIGGLARTIWSALFEREEEEAMCMNMCKIKPRKAEWKEAGEAFEKAVKALDVRKQKGKDKEKEIA